MFAETAPNDFGAWRDAARAAIVALHDKWSGPLDLAQLSTLEHAQRDFATTAIAALRFAHPETFFDQRHIDGDVRVGGGTIQSNVDKLCVQADDTHNVCFARLADKPVYALPGESPERVYLRWKLPTATEEVIDTLIDAHLRSAKKLREETASAAFARRVSNGASNFDGVTLGTALRALDTAADIAAYGTHVVAQGEVQDLVEDLRRDLFGYDDGLYLPGTRPAWEAVFERWARA